MTASVNSNAITTSGNTKPFPLASLAHNLLTGLATDIPLHFLQTASRDYSFPPRLTRALFSLLLRTSTPFESGAAQTALLHAQTLPQSSPAACLGFPADAPLEFIRDVVYDLLLSASRGDALLLTGKALMLFADAGPDADEYNNPTPDPRVAQGTTHHPLAVIRTENLARAIVVFAHAFDEPSSRAVLLNIASHNMSRFLAPVLEHLPEAVAFLSYSLLEAINLFYAKFAAVATDDMRQDFVTRLVCSIMRLAKVDPSGISPYMRGMADGHIRLQACRRCLTHRFGVKDTNVEAPLNVENVSPYLRVSWQKNRHNRAVPALLNSLLMAWDDIDDDNSFRFKANPAEQSTQIMRKLCNVRDRLSRFGASKDDLCGLNATIDVIGSRIIESNS